MVPFTTSQNTLSVVVKTTTNALSETMKYFRRGVGIMSIGKKILPRLGMMRVTYREKRRLR